MNLDIVKKKKHQKKEEKKKENILKKERPRQIRAQQKETDV